MPMGDVMLGSDDTTKIPTVEATPPAATPPPQPPPPLGAPPPPPPAWRPPPRTDRDRAGPLIIGVIILVVGLWFFATQTLGLDLPRLDWSRLWPLILIVVGIWIVLRAVGRAR
jgi:hypothetical protein